MKALIRVFVLLLVAVIVLPGCSSFTSIEREPSGDYILTGWQNVPFVGRVGFIWVCDYDPATKTLRVKKKLKHSFL